jgi:cysteine sulfinate desulfinase/cysteine desulfurase-like protein
MATRQRTYLDHNATSPLRPEAAEVMARVLMMPGNPSSVHAEGRAARAELEAAREKVARLVGARAKNVVFTSGGTEACNLILSPSFRRLGQPSAERLFIGAAEHPCILNGHRFPADTVSIIPVDAEGVLDLAWLRSQLEGAGGAKVLVSVQLANNETGVIQPVAEVARLVHEHGGLVHTDAVQAAGRIPLNIAELQELRDEADASLLRIAPGAVVFGRQAQRLPNTLAFAIPGLKAETALIAFDLEGIALSSGSACSSGKVKRSHVLDAMGAEPALAEGAMRVSLGWTTTKEDVIRFAEACERVVGTLYKRKASAA